MSYRKHKVGRPADVLAWAVPRRAASARRVHVQAEGGFAAVRIRLHLAVQLVQ